MIIINYLPCHDDQQDDVFVEVGNLQWSSSPPSTGLRRTIVGGAQVNIRTRHPISDENRKRIDEIAKIEAREHGLVSDDGKKLGYIVTAEVPDRWSAYCYGSWDDSVNRPIAVTPTLAECAAQCQSHWDNLIPKLRLSTLLDL